MKAVHVWKDGEPYLWLAKMLPSGVGVFCDGSLLGRLYKPWTIVRVMNYLRIAPSEVTVRTGYTYDGNNWVYRIPQLQEPTNEELADKYGITMSDHDEANCTVCRWNRIVAQLIPIRTFPDMRLVNAWKSFQGQLNPGNAGKDAVAHELWQTASHQAGRKDSK